MLRIDFSPAWSLLNYEYRRRLPFPRWCPRTYITGDGRSGLSSADESGLYRQKHNLIVLEHTET
jgi:hypothetical protein